MPFHTTLLFIYFYKKITNNLAKSGGKTLNREHISLTFPLVQEIAKVECEEHPLPLLIFL
jgi:hypothetical protein